MAGIAVALLGGGVAGIAVALLGGRCGYIARNKSRPFSYYLADKNLF